MYRAAIVAGLLAAAPLSAQDNSSPQTDAYSASDDLDCAVWALFMVGSLGDDAPADTMVALNLAVGWFSGLYEGKTGTDIEPAIIARGQALTNEEVQAFGMGCSARLGQFASRLGSIGN